MNDEGHSGDFATRHFIEADRLRDELAALVEDRPMAIDLKAVRVASGLTQREIAANLGLSERSGNISVAQIEVREDWLMSRVVAYIKAAGGEAALVVTINGQELRFDL